MKAGLSGDTSAIQRLIGRTRFRIRSQWALEGATTATILAAAAALAVIFAIRAELVEPDTGIFLLLGAGSIILIGAVVSALRPLDDESVARRIDRASNLSDRLSTAIAFRRTFATAGTAPTTDDETTDLMIAAIRDGERAVPRANIRAAAPIIAPKDWRAAIGFLAVSALAAGLAIPQVDRTPHLDKIDPDHARPGDEVSLIGGNLMAGITTPVASLPTGNALGAPSAPPAATAPKPTAFASFSGRGVFLGQSENPFLLEQQMHEIAAAFASTDATRALSEALKKSDLDRVTGEVQKLGKQLDVKQHELLARYEQLATRMSNNRPVQILDWAHDKIRIKIPADAAYGDTTLTVYVGKYTAGPLAFTVVNPKDTGFFRPEAVVLEPDERAYVERILAELRMMAKRDNIQAFEDFANKIEQLLKDAEEGKVTKEELLEALRKAEEAMNQGNEPNQAEIDKQMGELGKELAKQELTKQLGEALQKQDLDKAKQELEELARKLDPKEMQKQMEELQKKLQDPNLTEQQKKDLQKKLDELKKQLENKNLTEQQKKDLEKQIEELKKQLENKDLTEQEKKDLQKKLDEMKNEKPLTEQQKQELQKQLEKTAKQMQQQQKAQQEKAEQAKQKLEEEIRRLQKDKDQAKTEKEKLDSERRLEKKKDELKQLQKQEDQKNQSAQRDAIKRLQKDIEQAAENLQKKDKNESQQEQEQRERQASQKLKDAARETGRVDQDKRKQAAQKKMSSQMDDLREAMQRAKQKGNKGPQDPFNKQGKNQDFAQRARGQKGSGQAWKPGQGQGQGKGQGQGQNGKPGSQAGNGGKEWGVGHDPNNVGDATAKTGNTKDQDLEGKQGSKGGSKRETILAAAQKGFASKNYEKVYAEYQKIVEDVMRNEKLPSSYKYYVKRYFAKIHPSAGLDVEISKDKKDK